MKSMITLADEIIRGRRLNRQDDLTFFFTADLTELGQGADRIRKALCGNHVDLCGIINGKSGRCSEDCKFCAQSAHHHTGITEYDVLDEERILKECRHYEVKGVHRFSIVTAGRTLSDADFEKVLLAYRRMKQECDMALCASHGLLTEEQFHKLRDSGVTMYHSNIETSRNYFPKICSSHTFDDKIACIKRAKNCGLTVCSGGIIGMGETWEDRLDMAMTLAELEISSIPINALTPVQGTPLEEVSSLPEQDILRTVAMFRYINPTAYIRLAAGRNLMEGSGKAAFLAGANATITGDMLTTSGNDIRGDIEMLSEMGLDIDRLP